MQKVILFWHYFHFGQKVINKSFPQTPLMVTKFIRDNDPPLLNSTTNYLMEFNTELCLALRACIRHHHSLIEVSEMLEDFINKYVFLKTLQLTFLLCNLAFTLLKVSIYLKIAIIQQNQNRTKSKFSFASSASDHWFIIYAVFESRWIRSVEFAGHIFAVFCGTNTKTTGLKMLIISIRCFW